MLDTTRGSWSASGGLAACVEPSMFLPKVAQLNSLLEALGELW